MPHLTQRQPSAPITPHAPVFSTAVTPLTTSPTSCADVPLNKAHSCSSHVFRESQALGKSKTCMTLTAHLGSRAMWVQHQNSLIPTCYNRKLLGKKRKNKTQKQLPVVFGITYALTAEKCHNQLSAHLWHSSWQLLQATANLCWTQAGPTEINPSGPKFLPTHSHTFPTPWPWAWRREQFAPWKGQRNHNFE